MREGELEKTPRSSKVLRVSQGSSRTRNKTRESKVSMFSVFFFFFESSFVTSSEKALLETRVLWGDTGLLEVFAFIFAGWERLWRVGIYGSSSEIGGECCNCLDLFSASSLPGSPRPGKDGHSSSTVLTVLTCKLKICQQYCQATLQYFQTDIDEYVRRLCQCTCQTHARQYVVIYDSDTHCICSHATNVPVDWYLYTLQWCFQKNLFVSVF